MGNLTVYARTPPQPRKFHWKDWVRPFKSNDYMLLCLSLFMYLGLFLPLNYIIVQAEKEGMSDSLADKMLIIINAASCKYQFPVTTQYVFGHTKKLIQNGSSDREDGACMGR